MLVVQESIYRLNTGEMASCNSHWRVRDYTQWTKMLVENTKRLDINYIVSTNIKMHVPNMLYQCIKCIGSVHTISRIEWCVTKTTLIIIDHTSL